MQKDNYLIKNPNSRRAPLAVEVANKIVTKIQNSELLAGSKIPSEFELSEEFGVGRGTVREAVKLLVAKNILQIIPAKGTFVCENPGMDDDPLGLSLIRDKVKVVRDLLELRVILETYAVRNAALHATQEQIDNMKRLADEVAKNTDNNALCTQYDIELHKCIAESCGNSVISTVLPVIRTNMEHFNKLDFERQWDIVNEGHHAIIRAIEAHNPMLAEAETIKHLSYVSEKINNVDNQ